MTGLSLVRVWGLVHGLILVKIVLLGAAAATWLQTAASTAWNFVTGLSLVRVWGLVAGMAILKLGLLGLAAATLVAQVAQWALNIAMTANPIGIIVVAIGALIAGLLLAAYYAYRFRDAIWEWIQQDPLLGPLATGLLWIIDQVKWLIENVPKIPGIGEKGPGDFSTGSDTGDSIIGGIARGSTVTPLFPGGRPLGVLRKLLGFAEGGVVPGRGPVPIIAHGGEAVLTPQMQANLMKALSDRGGTRWPGLGVSGGALPMALIGMAAATLF